MKRFTMYLDDELAEQVDSLVEEAEDSRIGYITKILQKIVGGSILVSPTPQLLEKIEARAELNFRTPEQEILVSCRNRMEE